MDRTVPAGAARLLNFIRATEVGTEDRRGYDIIYGHNEDEIPKPVTSMSIDEVLGQQAAWSSRFGSSATGGYQFMRATLSGLKTELGLRGTQILDPNLQDRLGYHLLRRRGYDEFVAGAIDRTTFGKRLAQEWASFPVLTSGKGAHRDLVRGQSYYSGDALNKALVTPAKVEAVLDEVLRLARAPAPAVPVVRPEPELIERPITSVSPVVLPDVQFPVSIAVPPTPGLPAIIGSANKAIGAARGAAKGAAIGPAIALIAPKLGILPAWVFEPAYLAAFLLIGGVVIAGAWAAISTYRAPANT